MYSTSVSYETTLSPQNSMSLNTSGPGAFNYLPYMVPMGVIQQQPTIPVHWNQGATSNMSPSFIVIQSPSPVPFVNPCFPQQQQGFSTPLAVGEMNGQFFPIPATEGAPVEFVSGLQNLEIQSQQSSGSSEQCQTSPQQESVQPPSPASPTHTVRPPPGFHSKSMSTPQRRASQTPNPTSWSQRVNRKNQQALKSTSTATPKRQTARVKKDSSRKFVKPEARKKRTKYGYRSKQNKIDTVHENLQKRYAARGILADKEEVLRGHDVLRLHVKKFDALTKIEQVLEAAEKQRGVMLKSVSIPLSMKNEFQKKGFLVYCQLSNVEHVEKVKKFFQSYPEFAKCQIALPNLGKEGETDHPALPVGEPDMNPVETGSPELDPMEKMAHVTTFDVDKDDFSLDDEAGLEIEILPMLKNSSMGC